MSKEGENGNTIGRSDEESDRPSFFNKINVDVDNPADVDQSIDRAITVYKLRKMERQDRWDTWRQYLVITLFSIGVVTIIVSLIASILTLLTVDNGTRVDLSKWTLETLLGAIVAGLIAFLAIQSFEDRK